MTRILAIQYALMALVAASLFALSLAAPAMAEEQAENIKVVMEVLDSANAEIQAEMLELQLQEISVPIGAQAYYDGALTEYMAAKNALDSGNANWAKFHAMRAMEMFKTTTDLLGNPGLGERQIADMDTLGEGIASLEDHAEYLETLAEANNATVSFADYDSAMQVAKDARSQGDIEEVSKQVALAGSFVEQIQADIQEAADTNKGQRAEEYAQKMITLLSEEITEQEAQNDVGERESLIKKLANLVEELSTTTDFDEIIELTNDSSELQSILDEYEVFLSDSEVVEDESESIQEQVDGSNEGSNTGSGNQGSDTGSGSEGNNTGSGNEGSGEDPAQRLTNLADDLEKRANDLLEKSDNVAADLLIQKALTFISSARQSIGEGNYAAAEATLSEAELALNEAEELIA